MKKSLSLIAISLMFVLIPVIAVSANYNGDVVEPVVEGTTETYEVTAETGDKLTLANVGSLDGELEISFADGATGSIVVNELTEKPAEAAVDAPGTASLYFDIDLVGITNADITSAVWTFTVPQSFLDANAATAENIFLHHYNGAAWERLTTRQISSTATSVTFEADVVDFSPFAVTAVAGLSNTGTSQVLTVVVGISTIAVVGGMYAMSRKTKSTS